MEGEFLQYFQDWKNWPMNQRDVSLQVQKQVTRLKTKEQSIWNFHLLDVLSQSCASTAFA